MAANTSPEGRILASTGFVLTKKRKSDLAQIVIHKGVRGGTVVKVLCYKSEGRWLDPSWCQWIFHSHDSASNRNEYQEYFLGVKAAGA